MPSFMFQYIHRVLDNPAIQGDGSEPPIGHLFLVGGFAESPIVQEAIRKEFGRPESGMKVIIPQVMRAKSPSAHPSKAKIT